MHRSHGGRSALCTIHGVSRLTASSVDIILWSHAMSDCDVIKSPPARLEDFVACVRHGTTWYDAIVGRVNVP